MFVLVNILQYSRMKIICINSNYPEQTLTAGHFMPSTPSFFMKPDTALLRNNQALFYPDFTQDLIAEVGLVIRIDRVGRSIAEKFAARYCGAVGIGVDFTARDILKTYQTQGLPWEAAKAFDYSLPLSPKMIPAEEFSDLRNIRFTLKANGANVQEGNSGNMIFSVEQIIAYVSKLITLKIGDLIYTGTPSPAYTVAIGDRLQAAIGEEVLLDFEVK